MSENAAPQASAPQNTQAIQDVLALVIDAAKIGAEAEADGKLTLSDGIALMKLIPDLGPAVRGLSQVPSELAALGPEAELELVAFVTGRLAGSQSARGAEITAKALKAAVASFELFQTLRA